MKKIKLDKKILCLLLIDIVLCLFLLKDDMTKGHDMLFHLSRIKGLSENLKVGDFYAPIHIGLYGYGYANGLFYSNLFLYFPAFLKLIGFSTITSYKILIFLLTIATSLTMYYCVKKISKNDTTAFISSILYTTCSYRITDVVVRSALGEVIAYSVLPLIVLGLYELIYGDKKKWYLFTIGFILLLQSHMLTTLIMFIICIIIILVNIKKIIKEDRLRYFIYSALLGICLVSYFIFPFLEQYLSDKFVINTDTLETETWLRAVHIKDIFIENFYITDEKFRPVGIGIVFVIASFLRIKIKEKTKLIKFCDLCLITGVICLISVTNLFPWKLFGSLLSSIQFPWRMYLPATLFLSISSGIILENVLKDNENRKKYLNMIIAFMLTVAISISLLNIYPKQVSGNSAYKIEYDNAYHIHAGDYLPANTDIVKLLEDKYKAKTNNKDLNYSLERDNLVLTIKYSNKKDGTYIDLPLLYYKGYIAVSTETGKHYKLEKGENNVVRVYLNKKNDTIKVYYQKTKIQKISIVITLVTFLTLICLVLKKEIKYEKVS